MRQTHPEVPLTEIYQVKSDLDYDLMHTLIEKRTQNSEVIYPIALVVGGSGFLGASMIDILLEEKLQVIAFDDQEIHPNRDWFVTKNGRLVPLVTHVLGKVERFEDFFLIPDVDVRYVVFAAGIPAYPNRGNVLSEDEYNAVHVEGARNLMKFLEERSMRPRRVLFYSSLDVYGPFAKSFLPVRSVHSKQPISNWARSLLNMERVVTQMASQDLPIAILRLATPYGPKQSVETGLVARMVDSALRNEDIELFVSPDFSRDFVYVTDVSEMSMMIMKGRYSHITEYNMGSGVQTTLRAVAEQVIRLTGSSSKIVHNSEILEIPYQQARLDEGDERVPLTNGLELYTDYVKAGRRA
tara:strand:- start:1838 stop:2899 length:1062 start_codon:yes stop_codon:yes gene_type:complete